MIIQLYQRVSSLARWQTTASYCKRQVDLALLSYLHEPVGRKDKHGLAILVLLKDHCMAGSRQVMTSSLLLTMTLNLEYYAS